MGIHYAFKQRTYSPLPTPHSLLPTFCLLLLFSLLPLSLSAQNNAPASYWDNLTLKVAVIGPGDELYFWWGHIGLVVEDRSTGQTWFFDWGVFSFENENFFVNFAFGKLIYSCMVSRAESNYATYIRTNRDITLYTLDLPAEGKEAVLRFAENNMQPENRDYAYHHFKDNCATRIRDIIDLAVGGQFIADYGEMPGRFTLRQHVRRHTYFNLLFDWALNFWMGQGIDRPITVWDDMFLPSEIGMRIMEFRYIDDDGRERPLVSNVETINKSKSRPIVLDIPRIQWPRQLLGSLLFSSVLVFLFMVKGKQKSFRIFMGLTQSLFGLFFGIAGSMLFFMTFFTNHDYTYSNSNVIFVNPLFLALVPLGLLFAFTKNEKKRYAAANFLRAFWIYIFLGSILTMLVKLFPGFYQQNQPTQAMLLPIALVMIVILTRQRRMML